MVVRTFALLVVVLSGLIAQEDGEHVRLIAVGDLNLGRHVGQMLLKDSIGFPFAFVSQTLKENDIVFGNLESQITDQNGETSHPTDPYIFCAPPQAARALKEAGFNALSTANNHALDYGFNGLRETITFLSAAGIAQTGISNDSTENFEPVLLERGGLRFGFLAYTQFVNGRRDLAGRVSAFDPKRIRREIRRLRDTADVVIVSFHGGKEYEETPNATTLNQLRMLVDRGADIVFGHHPHVPQGIERYKGKWIFYSLGNFVFHQPHREWTQKSFAAQLRFRNTGHGAELEEVRLIPLRASHQPTFSVNESDRTSLFERLRRLSTARIERNDSTFIAYEALSR